MSDPPLFMTLYARDRVRPLNTFKNVLSTFVDEVDDDRNNSVSKKISNEDIARFSCKIKMLEAFFLNDSIEFIQNSIS